MSLTHDDLQAIRTVVEETVRPIKGDLKAFGNDIKEIYAMISGLDKKLGKNAEIEKLSLENKILHLHSQLVEAARQAGVTLPSHQ